MKEIMLRMEVEKLISRSCWLLDAEHFQEWVKLFVDGGLYTITAYSTEIRKNMIWMQNDKEALEQLFNVLPEQVTDKAKRRHVFSVIDIQFPNATTANVTTNFSIYRTNTVGRSQLYAVGQYQDIQIVENNHWFIQERTVYLDTRQLDVPSHIPL